MAGSVVIGTVLLGVFGYGSDQSSLVDNSQQRKAPLVKTPRCSTNRRARPQSHYFVRTIRLRILPRLFAPSCHWMDEQSSSHRTSLSVNDDAGETDVLLVVGLDSRERIAVMIEDNINANFQPAQAYRYRERGNQGCSFRSSSLMRRPSAPR